MNIVPTVLLIDSDKTALNGLKIAFDNMGYQTIATTDSFFATNLFSTIRPSIVVLEIFMPKKDGFEVTKEIRTICEQTMIVAISFETRFLHMIKILGANEAFSKQMEVENLAQNIHLLQNNS